MNHLQITFVVTDPTQQDILVALLTELGYEGFEQREDSLLAFLEEGKFDAAALDGIIRRFSLNYTTTLLAERNWNEEWERNFDPVQVGDFCAIRAHFHPPISGVKHELVITPKMSFGTGHHATTHMMIQAMQHVSFTGKTVLDFGTGTGVLAILAERLGAAFVHAIDNDDWSIENARENIRENHCVKVRVEKLSAVPQSRLYDIILANINKHILLHSMAGMGQQLKEEGVILMSGLLIDDFEEIENQALKTNLSVSAKTRCGSWICLKIEKSPN